MTDSSTTEKTAMRRIRSFERQHGKRVLHLACHAALPVAINAELMHLLRINFFLDPPEPLPFTAEFDVLLASFCHEVDIGLYEIDPSVRNVLLKELGDTYDREHLQVVASLLWQYSRRYSPWADRPNLDYAQQLTALNILEPLIAQTWLRQAEQQAGANNKVNRDWFVAMHTELEQRAELTKHDESQVIQLDGNYASLDFDGGDLERQQEIEMFTFPPTGTTAREPRTLNWSRFFTTRPTMDAVWETFILPDLADLRRDLGNARVQRLLLYPRLHSGFGFGVGAQFSRALRVTIEQPFPNAGIQMWASDAPPAEAAQVRLAPTDLDTWLQQRSKAPISIELSISRNVSAGIDTYLTTLEGGDSWQRLQIAPVDGPSSGSVPDNAYAAGFANQIGDIIRRIRDAAPGTVIHLFAALPLGLEILIGLQLNTCKPIQCYGYDKHGTYYPAYLLI